MLGNLKEFISVVQEGLTSNNHLRQTLQEVQKVKSIFKDKQKIPSDSKVNYSVGGELLDKYQEQWAELHENADDNARAAERVDQLIIELQDTTKIQLQQATELAQNLTILPSLTVAVAQCIDSIKNVQGLLKDVEQELVDFEDIVERSKMEKWKLDHHYHLTLYKEKKMARLEEIRNNLAKENLQKNSEKEKYQLAELQNMREKSSIAFQNDVAKYLASGEVPTRSSCTQQVTLEQIKIDQDSTDLENFLEE